MEGLLNTLFIFQIIISVLLVILVIFQKTGDDSLSGIGGGMSNNGLVSKRAATNILTKSTMILVSLFMLNCLFLSAIIARTSRHEESKIEKFIEKKESTENVQKNLLSIPEEE